jgi:putative sterol carrier protein
MEEGGAGAADVTVSLGRQDAFAMARGSLSAADALAGGRIRVRGDLSVLAAAQDVLASLAPALGALRARTELDGTAGADDPPR